MTTERMTLEEKDKLIAEYMGYKYFPYPQNVPGWRREKGHIKIQGFLLCRTTKDMKYSNSYDWIMEVVKKIQQTEVLQIQLSDLTFAKGNLIQTESKSSEGFYHFYINAFLEDAPHCVLAHGFSKTSLIQAMHDAVFQYIQWYNFQSKP